MKKTNRNKFKLGISLLLLIAFISQLVVHTLIPKNSRDCPFKQTWSVSETEQLVDEIVRKHGGIPKQSSMVFVSSDIDYPSFQSHDTVLKWRVRNDENAFIDAKIRFESESEFNVRGNVDVLYADGTWQELAWKHLRYGKLPTCFLPDLNLTQFNAPIDYTTVHNDVSIIGETFNFGTDNAWTYTVQNTLDETWRIITTQLNDYSQETIIQFAEHNQGLGEQLVENHDVLDVQVVFDQPVSQEVAEKIIEDSSFSSSTVYVETLNTDGSPVTWPVEIGNEVKQLDKKLQFSDRFDDPRYMPSDSLQLSLIGVVAIAGQIPASQYQKLSAQDDVLLVDVTPTVVREQLALTGQPISELDIVGVIPIAQMLEVE